MRLRHLVLTSVLLVLLCFSARPAFAADPAAFMTSLGDRVLKLVTDKQVPDAQRKQQFTQLAEQSFDIPRIAQFVLGRYWRAANAEQRQQFIAAFQDYMISVYWSRFTGYNGEAFKVTGQQPQGDYVTVTTEITRANGQPPVKVNWYLIKSGDSYKIRDASLEGVSQALTYKDEFASIIERNNGQVSALINELHNRARG